MMPVPTRGVCRGATPFPAKQSAPVSWTVSLVLHIALLMLASNTPWLVRLPTDSAQQRIDHRRLEAIQFLAVAAPSEPARRGTGKGQRTSKPTPASTGASTVDMRIPRDSALGERTVPSTTPERTIAPLVNAPSTQRAWLTPPRSVDTGDRGATAMLNAFVRSAVAAASDSVERARLQERKTMDWTLTLGSGARLGVSPMRVHLGLFDVPVPVQVRSMRDFDPQLAGQRRQQNETRAQSNRALRDSIVSARIRAIRERSLQTGRVPR